MRVSIPLDAPLALAEDPNRGRALGASPVFKRARCVELPGVERRSGAGLREGRGDEGGAHRQGPALIEASKNVKALPGNATAAQKREAFGRAVGPLLELSKCPDCVVNRGHYFGTSSFKDKDEPVLSDDDKWALIEFLKTF